MAKFLSGRQRNLNLGITSFTESKTVLQTTGKVGIGTTDAQQSALYVVGPTNLNDDFNVSGVSTFSGIGTFQNDLYVGQTLYAPTFSGGNINIRNLSVSGLSAFNDSAVFNSTVDVEGNTELNTLNVVGVSTFISAADFNDDFNVSGISTFASTVNINSELDVTGHTELDSLRVSGISTFQDDIYLGNDDRINLGESNDLQIYNDGFNSYIVDSGVGNLFIRGTASINFENAVGVETYAKFNVDGATSLWYDGVKKFETTSDGISIGSVGISTAGIITGPSQIIIDPAGIGDNTGSVRIKGDLYVDGEQFIVDSSRIELADFNVGIASTVPTNSLLDGAGIGIGSTAIRKTLTYNHSSNSLKSSENFDIAEGKTYKINGTEVLSQTQLTVPNLYSTGIGTIDNLYGTNLFYSGVGSIETLDSSIGNVDTLSGINLSYTGIGDIQTLDTTTGTIDYLSGINISYSGIGTIETLYSTTSTINNLTGTNLTGVNLNYSGISTLGSVTVGGATTELVVNGDARITGILTVGSSSVTIDGTNNKISVGTGVTIYGDSIGIGTITITEESISVLNDLTGSTASFAGGVNVSGVLTATRFDGNLNSLGKTYYVATTGSDLNSGNNINEPYLTIAQALSVATNGDIVNVSAGVYEETCPLVVPRGVTVKGAGLRATTIRPTTATKQENVFHLNDISTVEDFTVRGSYFDTSADTGYSFAYAPGIAITTRSPYIQRVTVLNTGSIVSASDPYGYDTADSPPTNYIAGAGAKVDGALVDSSSLEAGMLFNEVTFFTPNNKGIVLTNGARAEYLNCFHYFASQAIVGLAGTVGIAGTADARLKFTNPGVTPSVDDVVKLYSGGSIVAVGTITEYNDPYARILGRGFGTFTSVGIGSTQDVRFYQSDGITQTGIASAIAWADYTMFGAEMRSVGCAVEYGTQGVVADGAGVKLRLFATNFNHVGSGKNITNDPTLTIQANEVIELNGGQVSYVSIDQDGDFRVGDALYINQETGNVSFAATTYDLEVIGNMNVTDGSNTSTLTPTSLAVGNLSFSANEIESTSGDININPSGSNETNIIGNLNITGILTAAVLQVSTVQKGDTSIVISDTGSDGTITLSTDGAEGLRVTNDQKVGINSSSPAYRLDVQGDINTSTDVKINGVSVLTSASDEAIALAIALG